MKIGRLLFAASAALAACLWLAGCKAKEAAEPPPGSQELKVQETPVGSIYEEKGGVLYERPERATATPTPAAPTPATPSPRPRT